MAMARSPAVVVANHTSFLDALLIGSLLPGRPVFAVNTGDRAEMVGPSGIACSSICCRSTPPAPSRSARWSSGFARAIVW